MPEARTEADDSATGFEPLSIPTASSDFEPLCAETAISQFILVDSFSEMARPAGPRCATTEVMHGIGKRFVYILRSNSAPHRHYVGSTSDPDRRLEWHNHGPCGQTVRNRPWSFVVVLEFPTEPQAVSFERYLKSGSGRAFATRHFARE